jgi:hypothetical protein
VSFLLYYKARRKQAGAVSWRVARFIPLVLYALLLLRLALPWRRRRFWWATVRNAVLAPCARVGFAENFVADVLTSLPKVLTQVTYSLCYFGTGEFGRRDVDLVRFDAHCAGKQAMKLTLVFVSAMPLGWRLLQCCRRYRDSGAPWPHVGNAGKYTVPLLTVLVGLLHQEHDASASGKMLAAVWLVLYVLATLYSWVWDIVMDWGFFSLSDLRAGRWPRLRRERMYATGAAGHSGGATDAALGAQATAVYYGAAAADLFLRCLWALSLVPAGQHAPVGASFQAKLEPFLASAELGRRCMWGMLRLEAEHLNNVGGFRRVDFIPLHFGQPEPAADPDAMLNADGSDSGRPRRAFHHVRDRAGAVAVGLLIVGLLFSITQRLPSL